MLKTLKQKDTDYQFPTEALYTRKREWGWKLRRRRKTHKHIQSGERSKMSERFKNSSVLEKMGNNSTKETKAKVTL